MSYKSITKLTFYSIFMIILLIIGLTIFSLTFNDWMIYDFNYLSGDNGLVLPVNVQVYRAFIILCLVLFVASWLASLWEINKFEDRNKKIIYFSTGGIFLFLLFPYTLFLGIKEKSYPAFWNYLKSEKDSSEQINFSKWIASFKTKKDRLFWNTSLFIFVMLIAVVDFSLIWIRKQYNPHDPSSNILFNTFSFFTQWTNFSIIIFVIFFSFAHQTITFRNNTLLILMAAYITVVGVTFWAYLLPFGNFRNSYSHLPSFVKTVWLHGAMPLAFVTFTINSLFLSKEKPNSFFRTAAIGSPFPLIYGAYAYSICFVTRHSVYGIITNLNPYMVDYDSHYTGNPLYAFFFFGISFIFYFFFFVFWKIADLSYEKGIKLSGQIEKIA